MNKQMRFRHKSRWAVAALGAVATLIPAGSAAVSADNPDATTAMRTKLLGPGWNSPDVVRIKWISVTTWLASFGGHVVLLDSTVMDALGEGDARATAISLDDIIAAKPEYLYQNHVHLDQMRHASRITAATGAKLVGGQPECDFATHDAALKGLAAPTCVMVRDSSGKPFTGLDSYGSPVQPPIYTPWGAYGKPDEGPPGLDVTVVNIKHTQVRPYPGSLEGNEGYTGPDFTPYQQSPPTPQSLTDFATTQYYEGGNLLYMFKWKGFTLIHHGSAGSLDPLEPGMSDVKASLRKLSDGKKPDVEIGGIAELQNYMNGMIDERRYAEEIGAKVFFPQHHGNWNPPVTSNATFYYQPWLQEMSKIDPARRPQLCFVVEATRATAFSFTPSEWNGDAVGSITPLLGPGCYTGS
jgi:hypothetical protein